jgi:hypothetical protein
MSAQDDAKALIDSFADRTNPPGVWLHIDRTALAQGLRARIDNPDLINQGQASLCGPADFFRDLAIDDPVTYARAAIELYETGATYVGQQKIRPCHDLKIHLIPPHANIDPADWVLSASLRDQDNWFFDYQSETDDFAGITMPHSMADWFRKAGYTEIVNDTNIYVCKDLANAKAASKLFGRGYKVSLFINADMLKADTQNDPSVTPDHWVGLTSSISFAGIEADPASKVSFEVYTWGGRQNVPASGSLSIKHFLSNYYGYVACKR